MIRVKANICIMHKLLGSVGKGCVGGGKVVTWLSNRDTCFWRQLTKKGGFLNKIILTFSENRKIPPWKGLKSVVVRSVIRYISSILEGVYGLCYFHKVCRLFFSIKFNVDVAMSIRRNRSTFRSKWFRLIQFPQTLKIDISDHDLVKLP